MSDLPAPTAEDAALDVDALYGLCVERERLESIVAHGEANGFPPYPGNPGWRERVAVDRVSLSIPYAVALPVVLRRLHSAENEVVRMKGWTYCAYCGYSVEMDDDAAKVSDHIRTCPSHPMRGAESDLSAVRRSVLALADALRALLAALERRPLDAAPFAAEVSVAKRTLAAEATPPAVCGVRVQGHDHAEPCVLPHGHEGRHMWGRGD